MERMAVATSRKGVPGLNPNNAEEFEDVRPLADPGRGLGMLLLRAREVVLAEYRPIFRSCNLTEQQWRILRFIEGQSPMDATSLSERSVILAPSLTRIIRDLETRGLIERVVNRVGPSRVLISISPQGRELVKTIQPLIADKLNRINSRLTAVERGQLTALLDKIIGG
ncbi:homoprotocatechuate degradation operon regulator HpaR [Rhizobium sp. Root1204]|uniref:homoprotocatechuate degradation operon regulator HpaR n=1 Tax=Rhizobium sp. Root1204 TaxID=1736428 RepID=UPI0007153C8B|nr:homoprotocatechuate degradation operon regulator HpaR [Rhizobium sp. Root1204]KQV41354.1 hypothetical protein ASC96_18865 [Rhizobium sp. Root1204]